jgi:hypothetical protein
MSQQVVDHMPAPAAPPAVDRPLPRPSGPAAAVLLAAGFGSSALGLLSVLTAASDAVSGVLTLSDRVGDLSGVTTVAAGVFFAAWGVLAVAWRGANPPLGRIVATTAILVTLGLLGTFPPLFNAV